MPGWSAKSTKSNGATLNWPFLHLAWSWVGAGLDLATVNLQYNNEHSQYN
jgi:hypothetical protein